jgi:hypothetical protein
MGCNDCIAETFRRNPAGNQSRPIEPGQQSEASLAWGGESRTAKRRQRGGRARRLSPESFSRRRSPRSRLKRGPRRHAATAWRVRSCRGRRAERATTRVPREPGRPVCLHGPFLRPRRSRTRILPVGPPCAWGGPERSGRRSRGTARRLQGGREGQQESECPRSTRETGEPHPEGAGGGKGDIGSSNRWRETCRGHRTPTACQRDNNG